MRPAATPTPAPMAVPISLEWHKSDAELDVWVGKVVGALAAGDAESASVGAVTS